MLVYLFIEHYPNPYKPWIDTQIVQLLRAGHDVRVFAEASFTSTIHEEVREWQLQSRTAYYPATLKGLKRDGALALGRLLKDFPTGYSRARIAASAEASPKLRLLAAARAALLPTTAPDACYIHNLVTASRLKFLRGIYPQSRSCLYFHGGEVGGQAKITGEAAIFDAVDAVVTSTRFAANQAVERGCDASKIAIVPLGFHLPSYSPPTPRRYRLGGKLNFVSVGRMSPEKGFAHALEAVKLLVTAGHGKFTYTFVGSGIQHAQLREWATAQGLDNLVRFVGEKTRAEVAAALGMADVFVLPSIVTDVWAETQATVIQEALLMGCLTVTTNAGGVPESNAPVMHPFMVPPAQPAALAEQMRRLLEYTDDELTRLGESGRAFAVQHYDIAILMDRIMALVAGTLPADDGAWFNSSRQRSPG